MGVFRGFPRTTLKTDNEVLSLALVGENFRLLKCWLKRTAPADARRRCLQKKLN